MVGAKLNGATGLLISITPPNYGGVTPLYSTAYCTELSASQLVDVKVYCVHPRSCPT